MWRMFSDMQLVRGYERPTDADSGEYGDHDESGISMLVEEDQAPAGALVLPAPAPRGVSKNFLVGVIAGVVLWRILK